MRRESFGLLALALLLFGPAARADVVGPPPEECPNGGRPSSSHCGQYCSPMLCDDDTDCSDGLECLELELCIEARECYDRGGEPFTIDSVSGSCPGGGDCGDDSCETLTVCGQPEPVGVPRQAGCGCQAGDRGRAPFAALLLSLTFALAISRLRRR